MYLSKLSIQNFRIFDDREHIVHFNKGLTVLVGENDSGKSAVLDSIRFALGSTDMQWFHVQDTDFFNEDLDRTIQIQCKFSDLSTAELEEMIPYIDYDSHNDCSVYLTWTCHIDKSLIPARTIIHIHSGKSGEGPAFEAEVRELFRVTYLKALRDAYSEMQAKRNSRLSQILQNLPNLNDGDNYTGHHDLSKPLTELSLSGIFNLMNALLENNSHLKKANSEMTSILSNQMLLESDSINTQLKVMNSNDTKENQVKHLLEKIGLVIDEDSSAIKGLPGLGTSNIMSMACELLLKKNNENSQFLLIEEPEAHIHPQRQAKLLKSLENESENTNHQIILTTHSPLLCASANLKNIIIVQHGSTFSLKPDLTKLNVDDYAFLQKYLDATKANLFFARGVIIVEGPGEELLFPTLARLLGMDFMDYGVSIVNVRGKGFRRYAKIFQRQQGPILETKVSCVTDRDLIPNEDAAKIYFSIDQTQLLEKEKSANRKWKIAEKDFDSEQLSEYISEKNNIDGQNVKTFVSDEWTLEYDLAFSGLSDPKFSEILIHSVAKTRNNNEDTISARMKTIRNTINKLTSNAQKAAYFYSLLKGYSKAIFNQYLAVELDEKYTVDEPGRIANVLPNYIVESIKYVTEGENE